MRNDDRIGIYILINMLFVLVVGLGLFLEEIINFASYGFESKVVNYIESENIYSIKDSNDLNSSFVLGTGSFQTETVYRFLSKDGEYLKPNSISGKNIRILRDDKQEPHIEYIYKVTVGKDFDGVFKEKPREFNKILDLNLI